jgi:enamine deaminase RidA (YjgF/YER057c/UK114 family)
MQSRVINPWTWQDRSGFVQAHEVSGPQRILHCAGQASIDADGNTVHAGDMGAQLAQSFDNLETVLGEAGLSLANVVRLNYYTTDVDAFFASHEVVATRLREGGCRPSSTLLGVARLARPEMLVEIEATAVA